MRKLRNPHAVVPGGRARSKMSDVIAFHRHKDRSENGADGISDIEGKAARVAASERGQRGSFNGAVGNCDMAGGLGSRPGRSVLAVERCGKQPRYNAWNSGPLSSVLYLRLWYSL